MHNVITRIFESNDYPFFLIAGPCVVESYESCELICQELLRICKREGIPFIFKSSFTKANRSQAASFRGLDRSEAIAILREIRTCFSVPVTSDVHEIIDIESICDCIDLIQIPAFLSRQSALIEAAAETGIAVNIKKGQFLDAVSCKFAVQKALNTGNKNIMLTERGTMFGYNDLIVDFRSLLDLSKDYLTVMDCTHACQKPNSISGSTGSSGDYALLYARLALQIPCRGIFVETHPNPSKALSDASTQLPLEKMDSFVKNLVCSATKNL